MIFTLRNRETRDVVGMKFSEMLEELNRDRSEDWEDYTEDSTLIEIVEGINGFTEYELLNILTKY